MLDANEFVIVAEYILNKVVQTYDARAIPLPERRFLSVGGRGEVPHDTEQVSVTVEQGFSGLPGEQALGTAKYDDPRSVVITVEVVRKIPTTSVPQTGAQAGRWAKVAAGTVSGSVLDLIDPATLTDFAKVQMQDMALLLDAGIAAGQLENIGCTADVSAGTASGEYQAVVLTVTASSLGHRY